MLQTIFYTIASYIEFDFTYINVGRNFDCEILSNFQIAIPRNSTTLFFIQILKLCNGITQTAKDSIGSFDQFNYEQFTFQTHVVFGDRLAERGIFQFFVVFVMNNI